MATAPVLDSDVLIDHLRDAGPGRELVDQLASTSGYRITAVTAFELALGRDYEHDPTDADVLMAAPCLMLTREAAVLGGGVLRQLRAAGTGIDIRDAMQAGICLQARAPLVTRNIRHFARVPGLQVTEPGRWRAGGAGR
ncbi:MAG: type II toxin-antitoxin system VapC family toxin [Solirubrobacteraceae bacterium]